MTENADKAPPGSIPPREIPAGFTTAQKVQLAAKRAIDIVLSAVALLILLVPMAIVALLIKLTSRGPVFFRQERLGKDGTTFRIFKFRTMVEGAHKMGTGVTTLPGDKRLTGVGRLLRKTSLDELPQLINVLAGEMSLVGPRPTVPEQVEYYDEFHRHRLDVLPGITGWAMVHGRSSNPWSIRIRYDVEYVRKYSLWLDAMVVLRTIWLVLKRESTEYDYEKYGDAFDLVRPGETDEDREKRLEV